MKVEGTVVLDGLVEGTLPAGAEGRVRAWVESVAQHGLELSLEVDGDSFSLLPTGAPIAAARLGLKPGEAVREALTSLLTTFPLAERARVFSTLRSAEVRPGLEVQTVYVVGPTGEVEARERTVDAETRPAVRSPALRDRLRAAAVGVVVLAALLGLASVFFDLRGAVKGLWSKVTPVQASSVEVDVSAFEPWILLTKQDDGPEGSSVVLTLRRTDIYPTSDEMLVTALRRTEDEAPGTLRLRRRLAVEALARGRVHADLFGADGKVLGAAEFSVLGLRMDKQIEVEIRATRDPRTVKIALVP